MEIIIVTDEKLVLSFREFITSCPSSIPDESNILMDGEMQVSDSRELKMCRS